MPSREQIRKQYEEVRQGLEGVKLKEFKQGDWLGQLVQWVLLEHSKTVDAAYIRKHYAGTGPNNQARRAIKIASRQCGIAGGLSAGVITGAQVATVKGVGLPAPLTVPIIGSAVMSDVAYVSRTQLRAAYDLSAIYGAPLSPEDVEDCHLLLIIAAGVKLGELAGDATKVIAPKVVAYNVRKLLRSGLRKAVQSAVQRVAGAQVARKLTERAVMRLAVPGISVPVASGLNYRFTKTVLSKADRRLRRRGAIVRPVQEAFRLYAGLDRALPVKFLISAVVTEETEHWSEGQMDAMRHLQSVCRLSDDELADLDYLFEPDDKDLVREVQDLPPDVIGRLVKVGLVAGALSADSSISHQYVDWGHRLAVAAGVDSADRDQMTRDLEHFRAVLR